MTLTVTSLVSTEKVQILSGHNILKSMVMIPGRHR